MTMKSSALSFLVCCTAILLSACTGSAQAQLQAQADAYIREHISELSPRSAQVGGTFYVTSVEWLDGDTALVSYEDGHIALQGRTDIAVKGDTVRVTRIKLENNTDDETDDMDASASSSLSAGALSSSSAGMQSSAGASVSASASVRAGAQLGEFCGGIAGIMCDEGTCQYDGTYPDAGGTCVQ